MHHLAVHAEIEEDTKLCSHRPPSWWHLCATRDNTSTSRVSVPKWLQHLCTKLQANDDPFPSAAEIVGDLVAEFVAATQPCPALPALDRMAANANYHWRRNRPQHPQDLAFEVELNIRHILDNCPSLCDRPTTRSSREGEVLVYRCNILCCLTAISATVNAFVQRDDCNK